VSESMTTGVVKFFNNTKGYGFITVDNLEKDVFVHYSGIVGEGYRSLEEGDRVEFVIAEGKKGPEAKEVRKV
jgi:CspA family cold shock protein